MQPIDRDLQTFLGGAFSAEVVDRLDHIRDGLVRRPPERREALRSNFRSLIDERALDLRSWAQMTDIDFDSLDDLYEYLEGCYAYFFNSAATYPEAPY
ncbi:hypothetical protein GCM10010277_75570 [Streptomyces longisporoflavus]|uniref:hypothetical protein n=1 Tax=Streptomyces longisporoflavus TaxID=28044 RepID=UPI00167C6C26|nr:hypothetical protein [Streptomyces longisporoflavus]GGV67169.1 hypothetical protein GCM10010277_75570 [Streptomyces longisporoflavus]